MLKSSLLSIILFFSLLNIAIADTSYSRMYVFGDSLSDTGNLASVLGDFPLPYYMNRVSNGPVAVETLGSRLNLSAQPSLHLIGVATGANYAVAGASAYGYEAIDLDTQIISFQVNHGYTAPEDALYVIFIGGNDVRSVRDFADIDEARKQIDLSVDRVFSAIETLSSAGAETFLLVNAPDISMIPETNLIAAATGNQQTLKTSRKLSQYYRVSLHRLKTRLDKLQDIDITEFDLLKYFNKLLKNSDQLGFINNSDACFSTALLEFHPDCHMGAMANQFIFFDEIHPTARVHQIIGNAFYEALTGKQD